jgi:hypothetical protein
MYHVGSLSIIWCMGIGLVRLAAAMAWRLQAVACDFFVSHALCDSIDRCLCVACF